MAINVEEAPNQIDADYFVVPLSSPVVDVMGRRRQAGFPAAFHLAGYKPSIALKPGDIISVTIFEVGGPSTFGSLPTNTRYGQMSVPAQTPKNASAAAVSGYDLNATGTVASPSFKIAQAPAIPPTGAVPAPQSAPAPASPQSLPISLPTSKTFPPLVVEGDGNILIPYAGPVKVENLTPTEAAQSIKQVLSTRTANAQVLVSFISNGSNQATVGGEANRPGPVVLSLRGERLIDIVSQAGGSKWAAPDTDVDILRDHRDAKVRLQTVIDNPTENIVIRPDDEIFLTHNPRSFIVLGASQKVSQYTFDVPNVSLAEAVGRAGGPIDTIGNPAAVYLFREEPTEIASQVLRIASSLNPGSARPGGTPLRRRRVKVVYKINMNSAEGYFLARRTTMLDKDIVLIANAEGTQLLKLFTLVRGVTGAASDLNVFGPGGLVSSKSSTTVVQ